MNSKSVLILSVIGVGFCFIVKLFLPIEVALLIAMFGLPISLVGIFISGFMYSDEKEEKQNPESAKEVKD